jgi:hypothetical protein
LVSLVAAMPLSLMTSAACPTAAPGTPPVASCTISGASTPPAIVSVVCASPADVATWSADIVTWSADIVAWSADVAVNPSNTASEAA